MTLADPTYVMDLLARLDLTIESESHVCGVAVINDNDAVPTII
jgi:sulfur carrier protein ThiS